MNHEDESSSSSSSSTSGDEEKDALPVSKKRKAGRKKFRETRHPIYSGVRRKNGNKWVCEVREPSKKSRIWLGTFHSPEMAARAHDVAALALRGEMAKLNFPDSAELLPRPKSSSARDIQMAARAFRKPMPSSSSSPSSSPSWLRNVKRPSLLSPLERKQNLVEAEPASVESQKIAVEPPSVESSRVSRKVLDSSAAAAFLDEEALFNMPGLLDSMAEGLLLTPPAMKRGFDWDDMACDVDVTLWS